VLNLHQDKTPVFLYNMQQGFVLQSQENNLIIQLIILRHWKQFIDEKLNDIFNVLFVLGFYRWLTLFATNETIQYFLRYYVAATSFFHIVLHAVKTKSN
jgi:hypothetical protein